MSYLRQSYNLPNSRATLKRSKRRESIVVADTARGKTLSINVMSVRQHIGSFFGHFPSFLPLFQLFFAPVEWLSSQFIDILTYLSRGYENIFPPSFLDTYTFLLWKYPWKHLDLLLKIFAVICIHIFLVTCFCLFQHS